MTEIADKEETETERADLMMSELQNWTDQYELRIIERAAELQVVSKLDGIVYRMHVHLHDDMTGTATLINVNSGAVVWDALNVPKYENLFISTPAYRLQGESEIGALERLYIHGRSELLPMVLKLVDVLKAVR